MSDVGFMVFFKSRFTIYQNSAGSKPNTVDLLSLEGHNNNTRQHTWRLDQWQCGVETVYLTLTLALGQHKLLQEA